MSVRDPYTIRDLRVGDRREAALLADMWNRSDEGWPGGWTGGVPATVEQMLREMAWNCYGQWVAELRGEIVGFISLLADPKQTDRAYVGLLNARPDHHGKGVGRRLMRRAVEAAIAGGFGEIGIGTWPGNLKAVPLYKKMGFFWAPETSVDMQNFVPTILRMPLLAGFFEGQDWYRIQVRDLDVGEDVDFWHGVRVFRYRFAHDGQRVELVADRNAHMITAVETDDVSVAAWVDAEHLAALQEHRIHYELRSRSARPMAVSVLAHGETGVPVNVERSFTLTGRERFDVPFRLPADLERKKPGEPPHRVLTTVTVDGVPVKLGTAVQVRDPVQVEHGGWGFPAGRDHEVAVKLRNRLPFPVSGKLWASTPAGMERVDEKLDFRIPRRGWTSVTLKVRAEQAGAYPIEARVSLDDEAARRLARGETPAPAPRGRSHTLWTRAFEPGAWTVSDDEEARKLLTVESDRCILELDRAWGWMSMTAKPSGRFLAGLGMPEVGPPFGDFSATPPLYDAEVDNTGGAVRITTRRAHDRWPGLTVERTVTVTPGMLELRHRLTNASGSPHSVKVRFGSRAGIGVGKVTIPLKDGLVRHERRTWSDWPRWGELTLPSSEFSETWFAAEDEGWVAGMVWSGDAEVETRGSGGQLTFGPVEVPAGGSADLPVTRVIACAGDHKLVRGLWDMYVHDGALESRQDRNPPVSEMLQAGLESVPLLVTRAKHRATVRVRTHSKGAVDGTARLVLPRQVALSSSKRTLDIKVAGLCEGKPVRRAVTVQRRADGPTAGVGEMRIDTGRTEQTFPVPVIVVRGKRARLSVKQESDDTVSVDTGVLSYTVSAAHGGSIVSLKRRGREFLRSSYPEPRAYEWMNPWYGGLCGMGGSDWDRRYHAVRRSVKPVAVQGATGLAWKGAEVATAFTHDDLRWLRVRAQYLTTAGSNLLAVRVTASNTTRTSNGAGLSVHAWPAGKGRPVWVETDGKLAAYRPAEHEYGMRAGTWGAVEIVRGSLLALATPKQNPSWRVNVGLQSDGFRSASAGAWAHLSPKVKSWTEMAWVAACRSAEEAHAYRFLAELDELP